MQREYRKDLIEAGGFLAIVASLVFLALETRQNTNALYAASRQAVLAASQAELFMQVEYPELIMSVIHEDQLTDAEQVRLGAWLAAAMRAREFSWLQYRDGIIDQAQWNTELAIVHWILGTRRTRDWWDNVGRTGVSRDFAEFVDTTVWNLPLTAEVWQAETNWARH